MEIHVADGKNDALQQIEHGLLSVQAHIMAEIDKTGWAIGRVMSSIKNEAFVSAVGQAVAIYQQEVRARAQTESPYGVPYKPNIWGAGWLVQDFGVKQYFFHKSWPQCPTIALGGFISAAKSRFVL